MGDTSSATQTDTEQLVWTACSQHLPPNGVLVMTKIDDERGVRNEQTLVRQGRLWFTDESYNFYVYYTPTHWANLNTPVEARHA